MKTEAIKQIIAAAIADPDYSPSREVGVAAIHEGIQIILVLVEALDRIATQMEMRDL